MICPLCAQCIPACLLKAHLKTKHAGSYHTSFKCKAVGCNRTFSTFDSFHRHAFNCLLRVDSNANASTSSASVAECDTDTTSEASVSCNDTESIVEPNSLDSFKSNVRCNSDMFVGKLYAKSNLPRSHVQDIGKDVSSFISSCNGTLNEIVLTTLKACNATPEQMKLIQDSFHITTEAFSHLSTEYKRLKYFSSSGAYIAPVSHKVGVTQEPLKTSSGTIFKEKSHFVRSVPLDAVLKNFLELPDAYSEICAYIASLESNTEFYENFMQCPLWNTKKSPYSSTDLVLPIFVFCDDFECNNALGSHSKSLGGTYVSLPCLPPECRSAIDNMFLALLFNTNYRKKFGDDKVFAPLIAQLTKLEKDGITINTPDGTRRVFFITGLLLGDNKGINSLSGFVEAFSANYFCRFCKTHKVHTQSQCRENVDSLRTETSYNEDLVTDDPYYTGVKFNSVFNDIPSFRVSSNWAVDCFHDFDEGLSHYVLMQILKYAIPKYFSLESLNNRIELFDYGVGVSNRVPLVCENFASKKKLRMSGSEMLMFVKILGLLVGDLVPENDLYWSVYVKLRQLLDICHSKHVPIHQSKSLVVLVQEFTSMYASVTGDTLKPKMHNLLHYPRVLEKSGPIEQLSSVRFESKHTSLTAPAKATSSRVNPSLTFAKSHQLKQHFRFMSNLSIKPKTEFGPCELVDASDFDEYLTFKSALPDAFNDNPSLCVDWIEIKGTMYKPGMVLIVNVNEHGPVFAVIKSILTQDGTTIYIFAYLLLVGFSEHIHAYGVELTDMCSVIKYDDLYDPFPLPLFSNVLGEKFVVLKSRL